MLLHTAPHVLFRQISTRPLEGSVPSLNLTSPSSQLVLLVPVLGKDYKLPYTYGKGCLTLTVNADIFGLRMTVMVSKSSVRAFQQFWFCPHTVDLPHYSTSFTLSKRTCIINDICIYIKLIEDIIFVSVYIDCILLSSENPNCRHTTLALSGPQYPNALHTLPHIPLAQNSSRPVELVTPPTRRISPVSHSGTVGEV